MGGPLGGPVEASLGRDRLHAPMARGAGGGLDAARPAAPGRLASSRAGRYDGHMVEISSTSISHASTDSRRFSRAPAEVPPRLAFAVGHALVLGAGLWLLSGGGAESRLPGWLAPPALEARRMAALAGCGAVLLLRTRFWVLGHGWRTSTWRRTAEALAIVTAFQVGLPAAALGTPRPLGGWWDATGLLLFLLGSGLAMGADLARSRAFDATGGRIGLCTSGPYAWVRHPSFLGDLGWGTGWALLTHNPWALLLPAATAAHAATKAIEEERALERQEPEAFRRWAKRTKRFVPYFL